MRFAWIPLTCLVALPARAGVILEGHNAFGGHTSDTRTFLQGDQIRMERTDQVNPEGTSVTLFDGQRIVHLDPAKKTYTTVTLAQLEEQMAKMEAMKAKLPPEVRAKLESPDANLGPMQFKKGSGSDKVGTIACDNYTIVSGFGTGGKACLAPWSAGLLRAADLAPLQKLMQSMKSLSRLAPSGGLMFEGAGKWPGWPVRVTNPAGEELHSTTRVSREEIPASQFAIPEGYTEVPMHGFGMGAGGPPPSHP